MGIHVYATVARATFFDRLEKVLWPALDTEAAADRQILEQQLRKRCVGRVCLSQLSFQFASQVAVERYLCGVFFQERKRLDGEVASIGIVDQQRAIVLLPLVAMGLHRTSMMEKGFEVCHLVEQHQKEHVGGEVAVDADFVVFVTRLRHTVVAQFGIALAGDMKMHRMAIKKLVDSIDSGSWQVARQRRLILFLLRHRLQQTVPPHKAKAWQNRTWGSCNVGFCDVWTCAPLCGYRQAAAAKGRAITTEGFFVTFSYCINAKSSKKVYPLGKKCEWCDELVLRCWHVVDSVGIDAFSAFGFTNPYHWTFCLYFNQPCRHLRKIFSP